MAGRSKDSWILASKAVEIKNPGGSFLFFQSFLTKAVETHGDHSERWCLIRVLFLRCIQVVNAFALRNSIGILIETNTARCGEIGVMLEKKNSRNGGCGRNYARNW